MQAMPTWKPLRNTRESFGKWKRKKSNEVENCVRARVCETLVWITRYTAQPIHMKYP